METQERIKELTPKYAKLAEAIEAQLGEKISRLDSTTAELGYLIDCADLLECCRVLRDEQSLGFEMLMDLCGVDYQDYGRDEWQTLSASDTGFSRGTTATADAPEPE